MIDPRIEELTFLSELERQEFIAEGPHLANSHRRRMIAHMIYVGHVNSPDTLTWDPKKHPNQSGQDMVADRIRREFNVDISDVLSGKTVNLRLGYKGRLRRIELEEQLKSNRLKDPTGLAFSTRHFETDLAVALQHVTEDKQLALILFDMNGLKYINDSFGHDVGNRAIYLFLEKIVSSIGRQGETYRGEGGDEVYVILPASTYETAKNLIIQILKNMANEKVEDYQLSASCGLTIISTPTFDLNQAAKEVDQIQYKAKEESRKFTTRGNYLAFRQGESDIVEKIT